MRYFIMNGKVQGALEMLKKSLDQTPVIAQSEYKYLKLPPPSVCNKVLHSVAQEGNEAALVDAIEGVVPALRRRGVELAPRTVVALYQACERVRGGPTKSETLLRQHLDSHDNIDISSRKDTLSCLLENQVAARNKPGVMDSLGLMQTYGVEPSAHDAFTMIRLYLFGDEQRRARNFLSWIWFNGIYYSDRDGRVGYIQDADFCPNSPASHVFGQKAVAMMRDIEALESIPEVLLATALGLCALERDIKPSRDILSLVRPCTSGRLLQSTLLHLYTRTQQEDMLIKCVKDALIRQAFPPRIILEPVVMDAETNPDFVGRMLATLAQEVPLPSEIQEAYSAATGQRCKK